MLSTYTVILKKHIQVFIQILYIIGCVLYAPPAKAQYNSNQTNSVYQYAVTLGTRQAYLWIPPRCIQVRGAIISFNNLLELNWLEDPIIRECATKNNLAIILVEPNNGVLTPELKAGEPRILLKMLEDMANTSGYTEIKYTPLIPIDHSVHGVFTWNIAAQFPERTIAIIPVKTFALPDTLGFTGIPICYLVGETDEWPPVKDGKLWSRDFIWPLIGRSAVKLRSLNDHNLIGVVTDAGGGHLDWSGKLSKFMALYIDEACRYRLPGKMAVNAIPALTPINPKSGWLTDTGGLKADDFKPAPYQQYKGNVQKAYWFFDKETALAASAFTGDKMERKPQMLTFVQNGSQLPLSKQGFVSLQFLPEQDGITFNVTGDFFTEIPPGLVGVGTKLGHAKGDIKFRVISGPAVQTGPSQFQIKYSRSATGSEIWLQAEQPGDAFYKHAVQPARMQIPLNINTVKSPSIFFPQLPDQEAGVKQVKLTAISSSGLPVDYYVAAGPAIITGNVLKFTPIPLKSKYPVKVTVVAWQRSKITTPYEQNAIPVMQSFFITK